MGLNLSWSTKIKLEEVTLVKKFVTLGGQITSVNVPKLKKTM